MQKQTPHKRSADNIAFLLIALLLLIGAMATSSCSSERKGCQMNKGMIGFGSR